MSSLWSGNDLLVGYSVHPENRDPEGANSSDAQSLVTERVGQLGVSGQLSLVISLFGLHLERQGFAEFLELVDGHAFEH